MGCEWGGGGGGGRRGGVLGGRVLYIHLGFWMKNYWELVKAKIMFTRAQDYGMLLGSFK